MVSDVCKTDRLLSLRFAVGLIASIAMTFVTIAFVTNVRGEDTNSASRDASMTATDDAALEGERLFAVKVWPLLREKCFACHGEDAEEIAGEFSIANREAMLRGGESGEPGIVVGDQSAGTVLEAIRWAGLEMPPKENDRLSERQIDVIERWVELGAPWPDQATRQKFVDEDARKLETEDGVLVSTSGGTSAAWTNRRYRRDDLWAFAELTPPSSSLPNDVDNHHAIDFFIDAAIEQAGLEPATPADARTLIRRVTYDVTGLPPTPAEVEDFVSQHDRIGDQAYVDLVDRLLASPRYGEHAARRWFDVTRYADTGGMSNDYERSNMWRYRDYVIRSFNDDKPYDQFVVEQLAGDELADQSVLERTGSVDKVRAARLSGDYTEQEAEWLIATGFLRLGPFDDAMVMEDEARQIYLDDIVNITGQTFLATTMRCCKCHDHKFDPIPTRDYYRMYSTFATTQMAEREVPFLAREKRDGFERSKTYVKTMLEFATQRRDRLIDKRENAARRWFKERGLEYKNEKDRKDLDDELKPERHVGLTPAEQGRLKQREQDVWIWTRRRERYRPMTQSVYNTETIGYPYAAARKLRIKPDKPDAKVVNHILTGGSLTALGDPVTPGVLSVLGISTVPDSQTFNVTSATQGRRTQFANWVVDPRNVLTTRSIVNRIWQSHFGVGIARNSNNFGVKGERPSHPRLLDFLAEKLIANDWRIKPLHRMILLSEAYRRDSRPVAGSEVKDIDPGNRLLSFYPTRRLTAEQIRDGILAMTGELVHCDGGLPVRPEINMEVAMEPRMIQFSLAPAYQPSPTPDQRNRRTVYTYHVRGQADPINELFDQPGPNESCELRETAAVTPQVFAMLNSDVMTDRSIALAMRLMKRTTDLEDQLRSAFRITLSRDPSAAELERLQNYVAEMTAYHSEVEPPPAVYPSELNRSLVEEFTGESFDFVEILPVFADYTPDTKPADVDAATRALADACLLLFNSNEFMYIR